VWVQQAVLTAPDGNVYADFGQSVALYENTAIIGAYGWGGFGQNIGAAYVFVRQGGVWTQQAELHGVPGSAFGWSVALGENTALVAGYFWVSGSPSSAYVYERSGTEWSQQAVLRPSTPDSQFGFSVGLSGNTALVGSPLVGAAYVFVRSGTTWEQEAQLTPAGGGNGTEFGFAVALSGNTAVVGEYVPGNGCVFVRSGAKWAQQATFTSVAPASYCGSSAAVWGNVALLGCGLNTDNGSGATEVYQREGSTWTQKTLLVPLQGGPSDTIGQDPFSTSIFGDTAVIGAPWESLTPTPGEAFVFIHEDDQN
jgi:hypothetical protein